MVISDTLVGSFLDVLFLLLAGILSELHKKPRRKDWLTEKSTSKNLCEGYHLFDYTSFFLCLFVAVFVYSLPVLKWHTCAIAPIQIYSTATGGILCNDIMIEWLKTWKFEFFWLWPYINYKEPHIKLLFVFTKVLIINKNLQTRWWLWYLNLLLKR